MMRSPSTETCSPSQFRAFAKTAPEAEARTVLLTIPEVGAVTVDVVVSGPGAVETRYCGGITTGPPGSGTPIAWPRCRSA